MTVELCFNIGRTFRFDPGAAASRTAVGEMQVQAIGLRKGIVRRLGDISKRLIVWDSAMFQTVLALWSSGVFKAGDPMPGFPASGTFLDTENH